MAVKRLQYNLKAPSQTTSIRAWRKKPPRQSRAHQEESNDKLQSREPEPCFWRFRKKVSLTTGWSNLHTLNIKFRRTRNRLSQRAYRRRHAEYVRELRRCVEEANTPESEALKQMRSENQYLRKQLVDLQSKLTGITAALQLLTGSVSNVLDRGSAEGSSDEAVEIAPSSEPSGSEYQNPMFNAEPGGAAVYPVVAAEDPKIPLIEPCTTISHPAQSFQRSSCLETSCDGFGWDAISDYSSCLLLPQIPNIWSHEYQMGLQPYMRALSASKSSSLALGKAWVESNSPFSDHISTLLRLLRTKLGQIGPQLKQYEMYCHLRLYLLKSHLVNVETGFTDKSWQSWDFLTASHDPQPWHGMQKHDFTISST